MFGSILFSIYYLDQSLYHKQQTAGGRTQMHRKLIVLILFLISVSIVAAQNTTEPKKTEKDEKLRKDAVEFLRETALDVGRMRSVENRISFSAELASLMWFNDEKEARAMFAAAIGDFKQLLTQFDGRMNAIEAPVDDDEYSGGFLFGGGGRSPVERKFRTAMAVRQQIALSLAEHDAELAYSFFYDTASLISNPAFRKEIEQADKNFEFQLVKQIAETNASKAVQYGIASIKDSIDGNHIELLKKIYAKDADKGSDFGQAILSRIKSDKSRVKGGYIFVELLTFGGANLDASKKSGGEKAIYSRDDLHDIADQFAQMILEGREEESNEAMPLGYVEAIEKYAPGRGAQIRAKYKEQNRTDATTSLETGLSTAANANSSLPSVVDVAPNANSAAASAEDREAAETQMTESIKSLGKSLPKEERDKVVAQARKIISRAPGKEKKITALSLLAAQVAKAGDKELAGEIMHDAERLVNPQPKNYRDFLLTWMLASGYAEANPEKAFPILENTILRANETISAFVKVGEFMDVAEEMVSDGEVQVGAFGGPMIRGMTQGLGMANTTIISLAHSDFAKTRALTNGFDRIEVRVLAKMMVLRAVLDDKKPEIITDMPVSMIFKESTVPPVAHGQEVQKPAR